MPPRSLSSNPHVSSDIRKRRYLMRHDGTLLEVRPVNCHHSIDQEEQNKLHCLG